MRPIEELKSMPHLCVQTVLDEKHGIYRGFVEWQGFKGSVVFGYDENGFEHVSVSSNRRHQLPTWDDMCRLKDMFFYPDEMAVQIHPKASEYVHGVSKYGAKPLENVLHLWRPKDGDFALLNG